MMSEHDLGDEFETYMLVVAHPDDSEFSSAGTVARLKDAGKRVVLIQVTSGDKGTPDADTDPAELGRTREAEQLEAARVLGMDEVVFLRCEDGALMPDLALREKIVRMIRTHKPDVIITHDPFRPYALHPDHRAVGLATTDAVYPTARDPLYFPEHLKNGLEPHKTAEVWFFGAENPDKIVDITATFERKMTALRAHQTQVGNADNLEERMRERAQELAEGLPFELAEAFKVVQMRR
jgi:LmbE family N-acetylglucosaminyl deacetylase